MSPEVEKLHFAARRYCEDRFILWEDKDQQSEMTETSRHWLGFTLNISHSGYRSNVLDAIQTELERLTGSDIINLDEARELFALAGLEAKNDTTTSIFCGARAAMREEREKFIRFVRELPAADLDAVEPLPYVRILQPEEAESLWEALEREWGLHRRDEWYPLTDKTRPDVEAFIEPYFERDITYERLGGLLTERGVTRVYQLQEHGPEYELDASPFEPIYSGGSQLYWSSTAFEWIVYASYEASITVGGWLLDDLKRVWPEWKDNIWTTPFYE